MNSRSMNTTYKRQKKSWLIPVILLVIALLAGAFAAAYFYTPNAARPEMGQGDVLVDVLDNGKISISWPEAEGGQDMFLLYTRSGEEKDFSFAGQHRENHTPLDVVLKEPLQLRIQAVVFAKNLLGMTRELVSREAIEVTVLPQDMPDSPRVSGEAGEDKTLALRWLAEPGCGYQVCALSEGDGYIPLNSVEVQGGSAVVRFGAEGDVDMPSYDAPARIVVRPAFHGEGYVLYGGYSQPVAVERESLLGNELSLEYTESGERLYTLRWNETKGDYYEIQEWDDEYSQWETLTRIERTEELIYETGRLGSGSTHRYRVAAYDQEAAESYAVTENNGFSAEPDEVTFRASISPLYATIWPLSDLKLYSSASGSASTLATVPAGTALCVLGETGDWFSVRYKDQYGYIDSRYCMINLPEYIGDVCSYNITNSYRSVFKVHGYPIEDITWQVVQGFDHVDMGEGEYLAPYLYPCAKKLLTAAQAAEADGYRLKIYEAYRPNEATRFLYDTTMTQLENPLPPLDEEGRIIDQRTGMSVDPETGFLIDPETGELIDPATLPEEETEGEDGESGETDGDGAAEGTDGEPVFPEDEPLLPEEEGVGPPIDLTPGGTDGTDEGELELDGTMPSDSTSDILTLGQVMTDGRFKISSFLAAVTSAHNRGIALDLTLETLDGAEELEMQSAIHDLSWYAATYRNNDNARLLEKYMKDIGGLTGLTSEWWHFQDDETRNRLNLSYLYGGITPEGWVKDDTGWRYRNIDGTFSRGGSVTVDGKTYQLDGNGYVVE